MFLQVLSIILHILLAVLVLLVMVTIHELGHYLIGKLLKFKINEFAVGLGPKIFSKKLKNGEVFSLRILPLGGYCAFKDEMDEEEQKVDRDVFDLEEKKEEAPPEDKTLNFSQQKPWKRILVLSGGAIFNLISAFIFSFIFLLVMRQGFVGALLGFIPETGRMIWMLISVPAMFIRGEASLGDISGPIGAIGTMAEFTMLNWRFLFLLFPFLAANFAIFNLLPIPALDGSRIIFATIEWIRGKPMVSRKVENIIHTVGFLIIIGLMLLVLTPLDILRFIR